MQLVTDPTLPPDDIIEEEEEETYEEKLKEEEAFKRRLRERILALINWTDEELSWIKDDGCTQRLGKAFARRIKGASTGCFVSQWNFGKVTDICDILSGLDIEEREGRLNGWCEDEKALLTTLLVESPSGFSWHRLIHRIKSLRLCRLQISEMDDTLSGLIQLKALILTSNLISAFSGYLLPRDLRFLELYNNSIESLNEFVDGAPNKIFYLGIGRNLLVNSESLTCLAYLKHLRYLDVSDNDFLNLPGCMDVLRCLPKLLYLSMYGTPISMAISYRRIVALDLPELILFDGIYVNKKKCLTEMERPVSAKKNKKAKKESAKKNKKKDENGYELTGELQAYLFRVYGVAKPKAEKNIKNLYYFELECPLLDTALKDFMAQRILEEDEAERRRLLELDKEDDGEEEDEDSKKKICKSKNIDKEDGTGKEDKRGDERGDKREDERGDKTGDERGDERGDKKEDKRNQSERIQKKTKPTTGDEIEKDEGSKAKSKKGAQSKDGKEASSQGGKSKKAGQSEDEGIGDSAEKNKNKSARDKGHRKNKEPTAEVAVNNSSGIEDHLKSLPNKNAEIEGATQFKSKEIEWSRVLEFKHPIVISTSDLLSLRDTFRTVLKLRLMHKKTKIEKKGAKSKKKKPDPNETKIEKKGAKSKKKKPDPNEDPDKNVLLKEKLAVIPVPLEAIKWNQKYLGYKWDIENPCLAEKWPDVKDLKFAKGDPSGKKTSSAKKKKAPLPPEPKILTALLGVGVTRDSYT